MQIEAYILCWNEAKMVRHTLHHYSQFCSKITVIDNQSDDGTPDIIKKHFPDVEIKEYDSKGEINDALYIDIKNNCWKQSQAKYVIVCDMDELLYYPNISYVFPLLYYNSIPIPKTQGYNMISDTFPSDYSLPITQQVCYGMMAWSLKMLKQGIKTPSMNKSIIFSPHYVKDINYLPGSHNCVPEFVKIPVDIPCHRPLKLLHMKYLSRSYLKERFKLYASRLSEYNRKNGYGNEYENGNVDEMFTLIDKYKIKIINGGTTKSPAIH